MWTVVSQRSSCRRSAIAIQAVSDRQTGGQRSPYRRSAIAIQVSILLDCLVCYCCETFFLDYNVLLHDASDCHGFTTSALLCTPGFASNFFSCVLHKLPLHERACCAVRGNSSRRLELLKKTMQEKQVIYLRKLRGSMFSRLQRLRLHL